MIVSQCGLMLYDVNRFIRSSVIRFLRPGVRYVANG